MRNPYDHSHIAETIKLLIMNKVRSKRIPLWYKALDGCTAILFIVLIGYAYYSAIKWFL